MTIENTGRNEDKQRIVGIPSSIWDSYLINDIFRFHYLLRHIFYEQLHESVIG